MLSELLAQYKYLLARKVSEVRIVDYDSHASVAIVRLQVACKDVRRG